MSALRLCLLPGDGIGPEVVGATLEVLRHVPGLALEVTQAPVGFGAYERHGDPLPAATLEAVLAADATLLGAVTTPPDVPNYRSPVLGLRQRCDLFANVRPCRSLPHPASRPGIDLLIVRENTECLYAGRERWEEEDQVAITERVISRRASERIVRHACQLAAARRGRLTVVHKANVLRLTDGLFRRVAREVAEGFPGVALEELLVDACAMDLIRRPERFDVIVTTNLFGDILSDEASMLVGGLGLACSANLGERAAVFEPVHGSAPDIAGEGIANPLATVRSAALLLAHTGRAAPAARLEEAVLTVVREGPHTPDLGGQARTADVTQALIQALGT